MHNQLVRLASLLALFLTSPCWAGSSPPLARGNLVGWPALPDTEVQVTGEFRWYRHIDPVTGRGAVSIYADGKEIPLDFRQFTLDILLRPGPHTVKGRWSKEQRLVVKEVRRAGRRTAE
jgi:hypothetical protein